MSKILKKYILIIQLRLGWRKPFILMKRRKENSQMTKRFDHIKIYLHPKTSSTKLKDKWYTHKHFMSYRVKNKGLLSQHEDHSNQ